MAWKQRHIGIRTRVRISPCNNIISASTRMQMSLFVHSRRKGPDNKNMTVLWARTRKSLRGQIRQYQA